MQFYRNVRVPEGIYSDKTKQDIRLTGCPMASSRVSVSAAGTNDGEAPAIVLHLTVSAYLIDRQG